MYSWDIGCYMTVHLTNENYTIYLSNGEMYKIKPDLNGNISINLHA